MAGPDDLRWHSAASAASARRTRAAVAASGESTAISAAESAAIAAETVSAPGWTPVVTAAKTRRASVSERIETFFSETVPLVAPPAATTFIVTHELTAPSLRSSRRRAATTEVEQPHARADIAYKKSMCERFKDSAASSGEDPAHRVEFLRGLRAWATTRSMEIFAVLTDPGRVLIADGFGFQVPKGYIYAAMGFAAGVEGPKPVQRNRRARPKLSGEES